MTGPPPPNRLEATIEIGCPPEEVWGILGDFEKVELWAHCLSAGYRTTGPDLGIGSRRTVTYRHLFEMEQVITEWTEGTSMTYHVIRAPFPLRHFLETWTVTPSVRGSRVRTEVEYGVRFGAVGRLVNWLFTRHVLRFEMHVGQKHLQRTVESGPRQTPS